MRICDLKGARRKVTFQTMWKLNNYYGKLRFVTAEFHPAKSQ